ncbi:sce7726 family protein [Plantibacter sp. Leaf314]|uniref:sce7726 family protein n=1 Tax=Plantibacter sp. Leaf314 TaxID=1736333 RepID=UPI0026C8F1B1
MRYIQRYSSDLSQVPTDITALLTIRTTPRRRAHAASALWKDDHMLDADVRFALHARLREEHRHELAATRFLDELAIAGRVRIDAAVLNGSFSGYEIKSARDTLRRLPNQVEVYSKVLDFATLVVAQNHAAHAIPLLPSWWGVIEAVDTDGATTLRAHRAATQNPSVDPRLLCTLLWRDEALSALADRDLDHGVRSKPKSAIWDRLAEAVPIRELRDLVRESLKAREGWRADALPLPGGAPSPTRAKLSALPV